MCCPLRLLVSIWFQYYFTLLSEYFSPFPHGTSSLSVSTMYLALPVSSGGFLQAIRVLKYSRTVIKRYMHFEYGTITHYGAGFQQLFLYIHFVTFLVKRDSLPYNPGTSWNIQLKINLFVICSMMLRFGLFPFRSPLLGEYRDIRHIVFFSSRY